MASRLLWIGLCWLLCYPVASQPYVFLVRFTNKSNSPFSVSQPTQFLSQASLDRRSRQHISVTEEDLPVNPSYIDSCKAVGATVVYPLKWMNAVVVKADSSQWQQLQQFSFVRSAALMKARKGGLESSQHVQAIQYGYASRQNQMLGIPDLHTDGGKGQQVVMAFFDGGFSKANEMDVFASHFQENRILSTWDFVHQESNVYNDHEHGTQCFAVAAAYQPGLMIGPAYEASYHLLVTEDVSSESPLEELNWARAAEYSDSAGVDIISSSVGYYSFDTPSFNYQYSDMDGNTSLITQAADKAVSKGMLVVNSAGNEGLTSWYHIIAPADGDSVLAVGAVNALGNYVGFSSKGPSADGRIKPDVTAQGQGTYVADFNGVYPNNGTSYSCPLVSGLAAAVWSLDKQIPAVQLMNWIKQSASNSQSPDNLIGYGIPNYQRLKILMGNFESILLISHPGKISEIEVWLPKRYLEQTVNIKIRDARGRLIWQQSQKIQETIWKLPDTIVPGWYFMEISGVDPVFQTKLVLTE